MNCNKTEVTNNINNNYNCKNNKQNSGLMNYTYAEYVILSSTLAYAIGEELNDADLTLFLVFLSQLSSDLSLIITKRGFENKEANNQSQQQAIVSEILTEEDIENVTSYELTRGRKRKVKKRKVKKKKTL
ncbi:hypothetical protein GCM10008904_24790 [Paraclostridium ghonii]|uniref:Uncharacterized protein n=1 Tax=Paraclostridium ghonii TaxID=29358 RepID=A0ABU0MZ25_9FIRM|nr:hypothetical protein [Paeniclostridium ghonii]MDQ0556169.1 hypothetical protein [Paeniclostridium ghonii]